MVTDTEQNERDSANAYGVPLHTDSRQPIIWAFLVGSLLPLPIISCIVLVFLQQINAHPLTIFSALFSFAEDWLLAIGLLLVMLFSVVSTGSTLLGFVLGSILDRDADQRGKTE